MMIDGNSVRRRMKVGVRQATKDVHDSTSILNHALLGILPGPTPDGILHLTRSDTPFLDIPCYRDNFGDESVW